MEVVGSSFAQTQNVDENLVDEDVDGEYEEVDEEGEGMVEAPAGRKANYTVDEDVLLCKTWLKIGMDRQLAPTKVETHIG
jgi:hypothetical protein